PVRLLFSCLLYLHLAVAWSADSVKIAVVVGLSGPNAIYGEGQLHAFNAAADIVNARGGVLGGRKVQIVPMDHKNTPQEALIQLKRALDDDIGYVASTVSSVVHALSDAVSKHVVRNPDKPVLLLNFNSLDPALTESKCSFWQFRFEPHADMQLAALTKFMASQKSLQKVYLLNQDYAFGQGVSKGSREQLNSRRPDIAIVGDELIPLAKVKDFAPYIAKIRATGADSVLTGNWGTDLSLLLKASNEMGFKAHYYALLAAGFGTPSAIGAAGADRIKTIYSWHLNATDSKWERTILDYQKRFNTQADIAYLPAFRTVEMLASAINKAGSTDPIKVAHALEGLHFDGPTGDSWMRAEDHQIIAPLYVMSFVKAGQAGAKHDIEGTGYGWKTEAIIASAENVPAIKCQMERPPK
ncbi:MAG: branched-chain amino acid ABC transporter substrate-binding protein, partial [Burkholderiales bacterium]